MLFGFKSEHKFSSVLNWALFQVRFLIFRCKIDKQLPNMHMYFLLIKNVKLVKKKIAQRHEKLKCFQKKWCMIL